MIQTQEKRKELVVRLNVVCLTLLIHLCSILEEDKQHLIMKKDHSIKYLKWFHLIAIPKRWL